jgi:hypothetical protein
MKLTTEQAIVIEIIEKLKTITIENGYLSEVGEVLHHNDEKIPEQESAYYALNVKDMLATETDEMANAENPAMEIIVETGVMNVDELWLAITNLNKDVRKCIGSNINNFREKFGMMKFKMKTFGINAIETTPERIAEGEVSFTVEFVQENWLKDEPEYDYELE